MKLLVAVAASAGCAAAGLVPPGLNPRNAGTERGILFTNNAAMQALPKAPITWAYNYKSVPDNAVATDQEFVPMLYNGQDSAWSQNAEAAIQRGSKNLLAFNEPDQPVKHGGTAIDPATAAQLYQEKMNPFKGRAQLGAPGVSAGGIGWLQQFAQACGGKCHVDFIPLHFYASVTQSAQVQAQSFQGFMDETIPKVRGFFNNDKLPIWITEFSALPFSDANPQLNAEYLSSVMPYLEKNRDIVRYSYFLADNLVAGGQLNAAGQQYTQN